MYNPASSPAYSAALAFATRKHAGQNRIGGADYITHPVAVARMLADNGFPLDVQIAGLLHDLLEDTDAAVEELAQLGGEQVAEAVVLLTKESGYRMDDYIRRIRGNPIAAAVKAADRYHNLTCAVLADEGFRRKYAIETIRWYLDFEAFQKEISAAVEALIKTLTIPLYEVLPNFIPALESCREQMQESDRSPVRDSSQTWIDTPPEVSRFVRIFYLCQVPDTDYFETLHRYRIDTARCDPASLAPDADLPLVRALLTWIVRRDRFCDGALRESVRDGSLIEVLRRLETLLPSG